MTRLRTIEPVIVSFGAMAFLVLGTGAGAAYLDIRRIKDVGEQRWLIKPGCGA